MPRKPKAAYHHGDLRATIIKSSLNIIESEGLSALTLRRVAKESGVSHAAPYAHFRDLNDLLAAIKDEGFNELLHLVTKTAESGPKGRKALRAISEVYLQFAQQQSAKFEIMFHRPLEREPSIPYSYIKTGRVIFSIAAKAVKEFLPETTSNQNVYKRTIACWSAIHGLCSLWVGGTLQIIAGQSSTASLNTMADSLIKGLISDLEFCTK